MKNMSMKMVLTSSMDKNPSGGDDVVVVSKRVEQIDCQELVTKKDGNAEKNSEAFDVLLDEDVIGEVLDPRGNGKDNSLSLKAASLCGEHKMQQADMEVEKAVFSSWAWMSLFLLPRMPKLRRENAQIKRFLKPPVYR
ncbi:hypothetical protein SLA2020_261530 [Shorea laevis]